MELQANFHIYIIKQKLRLYAGFNERVEEKNNFICGTVGNSDLKHFLMVELIFFLGWESKMYILKWKKELKVKW